MCGYDGRLGTEAVGLDAAHVRWWAFDGPDTVDNALCLCSFHHKLLDRGVVGIGDDHTVDVSARFVGRGRAAEVFVLELLGKPLHEPQRGRRFPLSTMSSGTVARSSPAPPGFRCRRDSAVPRAGWA